LGGDDARSLKSAADAIVVVGSEGRGLSPAVRSLLQRRITIRRRGRAESLNAAVAAGIVIDRLTQDLP
jgi:TrmH family RNA methyltransferase